MLARPHRWVLAVVLTAASVVACRDRARVVSSVDVFDVTVSVRPDGAVDVNEQITVPATDASRSFSRQAPVERYDNVTGVSALLDGRVVGTQRAVGTGTAWIKKIGRGPGIDVTWTLPPNPQAIQPFRLGLRYRASGAMEVSGVNGTFFWRALAASHSFDAAAVRIVLELPEKPVLVGTIGIQEAGWRITPTPNGGVAEKNNVSRFESATIVARFAVESGTIARPVWQENFERGQLLAPAFVSGGGFILVVGLGVLVMVRVQAPGWSAEERIRVLKGLRVAGFVVILLGIFVAFITPRLLGHFGPAPNAIAISILVVGLLFIGTALVWNLRKRI